MTELSDLAKILTGVSPRTQARPRSQPRWTTGTITSVNSVTGEVQVQIAGNKTSVPAFVLDSYIPKVGDNVEMIVQQPKSLVLGSATPVAQAQGTLIFDFPGVLVTSVSDPYAAPAALFFKGLSANLAVKGSSNVTFTLNKNGAVIVNATMIVTQLPLLEAIDLSMNPGDSLSLTITNAGTNAAGLVVALN